MISERSCDIEDWRVLMLKIQLCAAENKIIIIDDVLRKVMRLNCFYLNNYTNIWQALLCAIYLFLIPPHNMSF